MPNTPEEIALDYCIQVGIVSDLARELMLSKIRERIQVERDREGAHAELALKRMSRDDEGAIWSVLRNHGVTPGSIQLARADMLAAGAREPSTIAISQLVKDSLGPLAPTALAGMKVVYVDAIPEGVR